MSQEKFNGFNIRRKTQKGKGSNIPDSSSQEGSTETSGNKTQTPSSKSGLTDFKKLATIGAIGAGLAVLSTVVLRIVRRDDSDKL